MMKLKVHISFLQQTENSAYLSAVSTVLVFPLIQQFELHHAMTLSVGRGYGSNFTDAEPEFLYSDHLHRLAGYHSS